MYAGLSAITDSQLFNYFHQCRNSLLRVEKREEERREERGEDMLVPRLLINSESKADRTSAFFKLACTHHTHTFTPI